MLRTSTCGELTSKNLGQNVTLCGWVDTRRDHGNLIFIDLRDRWGITQLVFNPKQNEAIHKEAQKLRGEFVIQIEGKVEKRPEGTINKKIPTGEIEVHVAKFTILNTSPVPPFEIIDDTDVSEELRLKYRYLDLRRKSMVKNLTTRYQITKIARDYFDTLGFLEIETPFLTKSTPEGARDFLVPSRLSPGEFYALPQSPQLFKQILMVAGMDRYFQLARCFRDEDLRADRQYEHTQIDVEMSFVDQVDVMATIEPFIVKLFDKILNLPLKAPFRKMPYEEAMNKYGSDKPDLRYSLEIQDLGEVFKASQFQVFTSALQNKGVVKGLVASNAGSFSRKDFDELTSFVQEFGAKGLIWVKVGEGNVIESPAKKFLSDTEVQNLLKQLKAKTGDVAFLVAAPWDVACKALGALRLKLVDRLKIAPTNPYEILWVVDFPLLEWNEEEKRYQACHHPFTSPRPEDLARLVTHPGEVKARAYDLVLNGTEIGGGSIRIHQEEVQEKVFEVLGIKKEEAQSRFGFLLTALKFSAPPHGGIALGLDRLTAVLLGLDSIRDVIAFPKTSKGICLMSEAPSVVSDKQLKEVHIAVKK